MLIQKITDKTLQMTNHQPQNVSNFDKYEKNVAFAVRVAQLPQSPKKVFASMHITYRLHQNVNGRKEL